MSGAVEAASGPQHPPGAGLDPAEAARLRLAVARLNRQLVQASSRRDLTFSQLSALARTEQHGPLRLGELAARERVAAPSMTRTLAPLVAEGLIGREPDPTDGRCTLMAITPYGREVIDRIRQERSELLARRLGRLSDEQTEALRAALPVLERLTEEDEAEA